jgi:ligand-binding sensor domain-containing protein
MTFSAITSINDSALYVGTKGGVYRASVRGDEIDIVPLEGMQHVAVNVNTFHYSAPHRTLLIGTEDAGIMAYRESSHEVIHHKDLLPDVRVTKIIPYTASEVLFSTNAACVFRMSLDDCLPHSFLSADYNTDYRMNTDNVADICIDQEGQLWMCSFPKGLTVRNDHYPALNWIRRSNLNVNTLTNNGVNYILEDSEHDLWYATDNGVSIYDMQRKRWQTLLSMSDVSPNPNHDFLTMCEVRPGKVLLGGYAAGIYIIDKSTWKVDFVKPDLIIPEKYIQTMCLDPTDGTVWAGGENQLFNLSYDGTLRVNYTEIFGGINCITRKDDGHLWIGTKNGLFCFEKDTRTKRRVELPLSRFRVNSMFQDSDGTVYVGTHHHGLLVFNEKENYYCHYNCISSFHLGQ